MIRKLLVIPATLLVVAAFGLAGGVTKASAETIVIGPITVPTAKPDLVMSGLSGTMISVTNKPDPAYPATASAGPFWIHVVGTLNSCYLSWGVQFCGWHPVLDTWLYESWLPAGQTHSFWYSDGNDHHSCLSISIDAYGQVGERDETNNFSQLGYCQFAGLNT